MSEQLVAAAEAWLAQDPDPATRAETSELLARITSGDDSAAAELHDRFGSRLAFGTAGLRGALGAGPNRMNRVLVGQAAAGIGRFLLARGANPTVVIGFDGRVNSDVFATDSAEILAGLGIHAVLLPRALPTPLLAFAVRHLNADAGIMVTASHNPPQDNGYKVYLGGDDHGSQIISPADGDIAARIADVAKSVRFDEHPRGSYETVGETVIDAYVAATAALLAHGEATPTFVYTAMHGVGTETFMRVLDAAGYPRPVVVTEQRDPDGAFPTVTFPNPEEPGALDLAIALAEREDVDLIVAHDPDADRLAIAIPDGAGSFRRLTGNEVGLLLAWHICRQLTGEDQPLEFPPTDARPTPGTQAVAPRSADGAPEGTLACSVVSSPGLRAVAEAYGLEFVDTSTGFKWISRAPNLVFGFEEALGYLVNPQDLRDKDGISASAMFLSIASELAAAGKTVAEHLDEFVAKFGCFASSQVSIRVTDLAVIRDAMARLREQPPTRIGSIRIDRIEDFADGFAELPPSNTIRIWMADGSRVMVRPSGTEPKLKIYIDAVSCEGTVAERRATADAIVAELEAGVRELI